MTERTRAGSTGRRSKTVESRAGVDLTNLDQPLYDGADATKRDLVDYLDAVHERLLPELRDRPLSVIRIRPGQPAFMQKNIPKHAPDWIPTVTVWAEASHREVSYALCHDRRTLLWFANQRAVEYHPTVLLRGGPAAALGREPVSTHLVLDLDPPEGAAFAAVADAAIPVRQALVDAGLAANVKTSGAKGIHIVVPLAPGAAFEDVAAATRALAARAERLDPSIATTAFLREDREGKVFLDSTRSGGATVVAAYSPRVRPGVPVSFPVTWDELAEVVPADLTIQTAVDRLAGRDPWHDRMPAAQVLPADLVAEGHTIPVARVQAMHEGKRRKRARGE